MNHGRDATHNCACGRFQCHTICSPRHLLRAQLRPPRTKSILCGLTCFILGRQNRDGCGQSDVCLPRIRKNFHGFQARNAKTISNGSSEIILENYAEYSFNILTTEPCLGFSCDIFVERKVRSAPGRQSPQTCSTTHVSPKLKQEK